ncbi:MAG: molecular chaperone DnaJ [Maricaulis sp.]|nr:molecular chaperone DnaJ [Maricaulis sp.]
MDDPYKTLGVEKTASQDEIRKAYRKLAKELHPDANPGNEKAEERFKHVSQAFKLLSDPEKRAEYDAAARAGFAGMGMGGAGGPGGGRGPFNFRQGRNRSGFEDFGDIFSDLFTDMGAQQRQAPPRKGQDVRYSLTLDFLDAAGGGKHRVTLPGGRTLDVAVPPGAADGQVLRLRGQGEPSPGGGRAGDAFIEIKVADHKYFSRDGENVRLELPVTVKEAALGAKVRVPTIDGPVDLQIPAGSSSGTLLRLRGRGFASSKGKRGDQMVRLMVALPASDKALADFLETWTPPKGYDPRKGMRS